LAILTGAFITEKLQNGARKIPHVTLLYPDVGWDCLGRTLNGKITSENNIKTNLVNSEGYIKRRYMRGNKAWDSKI
jgi:hypothetical protein